MTKKTNIFVKPDFHAMMTNFWLYTISKHLAKDNLKLSNYLDEMWTRAALTIKASYEEYGDGSNPAYEGFVNLLGETIQTH